MKKDVLKLAILVLTLITCNVKAQTYSITINSEAEPIPNVLKSGDVINISYGTFTYYQVFF